MSIDRTRVDEWWLVLINGEGIFNYSQIISVLSIHHRIQ